MATSGTATEAAPAVAPQPPAQPAAAAEYAAAETKEVAASSAPAEPSAPKPAAASQPATPAGSTGTAPQAAAPASAAPAATPSTPANAQQGSAPATATNAAQASPGATTAPAALPQGFGQTLLTVPSITAPSLAGPSPLGSASSGNGLTLGARQPDLLASPLYNTSQPPPLSREEALEAKVKRDFARLRQPPTQSQPAAVPELALNNLATIDPKTGQQTATDITNRTLMGQPLASDDAAAAGAVDERIAAYGDNPNVKIIQDFTSERYRPSMFGGDQTHAIIAVETPEGKWDVRTHYLGVSEKEGRHNESIYVGTLDHEPTPADFAAGSDLLKNTIQAEKQLNARSNRTDPPAPPFRAEGSAPENGVSASGSPDGSAPQQDADGNWLKTTKDVVAGTVIQAGYGLAQTVMSVPDLVGDLGNHTLALAQNNMMIYKSMAGMVNEKWGVSGEDMMWAEEHQQWTEDSWVGTQLANESMKAAGELAGIDTQGAVWNNVAPLTQMLVPMPGPKGKAAGVDVPVNVPDMPATIPDMPVAITNGPDAPSALAPDAPGNLLTSPGFAADPVTQAPGATDSGNLLNLFPAPETSSAPAGATNLDNLVPFRRPGPDNNPAAMPITADGTPAFQDYSQPPHLRALNGGKGNASSTGAGDAPPLDIRASTAGEPPSSTPGPGTGSGSSGVDGPETGSPPSSASSGASSTPPPGTAAIGQAGQPAAQTPWNDPATSSFSGRDRARLDEAYKSYSASAENPAPPEQWVQSYKPWNDDAETGRYQGHSGKLDEVYETYVQNANGAEVSPSQWLSDMETRINVDEALRAGQYSQEPGSGPTNRLQAATGAGMPVGQRHAKVIDEQSRQVQELRHHLDDPGLTPKQRDAYEALAKSYDEAIAHRQLDPESAALAYRDPVETAAQSVGTEVEGIRGLQWIKDKAAAYEPLRNHYSKNPIIDKDGKMLVYVDPKTNRLNVDSNFFIYDPRAQGKINSSSNTPTDNKVDALSIRDFVEVTGMSIYSVPNVKINLSDRLPNQDPTEIVAGRTWNNRPYPEEQKMIDRGQMTEAEFIKDRNWARLVVHFAETGNWPAKEISQLVNESYVPSPSASGNPMYMRGGGRSYTVGELPGSGIRPELHWNGIFPKLDIKYAPLDTISKFDLGAGIRISFSNYGWRKEVVDAQQNAQRLLTFAGLGVAGTGFLATQAWNVHNQRSSQAEDNLSDIGAINEETTATARERGVPWTQLDKVVIDGDKGLEIYLPLNGESAAFEERMKILFSTRPLLIERLGLDREKLLEQARQADKAPNAAPNAGTAFGPELQLGAFPAPTPAPSVDPNQARDAGTVIDELNAAVTAQAAAQNIPEESLDVVQLNDGSKIMLPIFGDSPAFLARLDLMIASNPELFEELDVDVDKLRRQAAQTDNDRHVYTRSHLGVVIEEERVTAPAITPSGQP